MSHGLAVPRTDQEIRHQASALATQSDTRREAEKQKGHTGTWRTVVLMARSLYLA